MECPEKSKDCLFHENVLKEICRLCAGRIKKQKQKTKDIPRSVASCATLVEVLYDIVAYSDQPHIHPSKVCMKCYSKLHRLKKNPSSPEATAAKKSVASINCQWSDHDYSKSLQNCFACRSFLETSKAGRPSQTQSPQGSMQSQAKKSPPQTKKSPTHTLQSIHSTHFCVRTPNTVFWWPKSPLSSSTNTQQDLTPPSKNNWSENATHAQTVKDGNQTPPSNKENVSHVTPPGRDKPTVDDILNSPDTEPPTPLHRRLFSKLLKKHQNASSSKVTFEADSGGPMVRLF